MRLASQISKSTLSQISKSTLSIIGETARLPSHPKILKIFVGFGFFEIYLRKRGHNHKQEEQRKRIETISKQNPCWAWYPMHGSIPWPGHHDLSLTKSQTFNQLSPPEAPILKFFWTNFKEQQAAPNWQWRGALHQPGLRERPNSKNGEANQRNFFDWLQLVA